MCLRDTINRRSSMKSTQKILSLLLAACLLLCCAPLALADTPTFSDAASAAAYIRAGMLERKAEIPFLFEAAAAEIGELTGANLRTYFKTKWDEIDAATVAHTGVSTEGDYLNKHLGLHGYSYSISYSYDTPTVTYQVTATAEYHTTLAQEKQVTTAVSNALKQLKLDGKNDYEKIRAINDYICDKVTYDYKNLNNDAYDLKYSAYAALINGTSVCQGYASLFYRMALEAGLDSRIISGTADNGEGIGAHAWNIVKLGGKYYYIDVTWNDGTKSDKYFLIGKDGFKDHFPDDEFTGKAFTSAYPIAEKTFKPGDPIESGCGGKHQAVTDAAVPATCTKDGLTAGSHCAVCGEILKAQTVVKAKGHKAVTDPAVPATCTAAGKTAGSHCEVCGEILTAQAVVKAAGHQWDGGQVTKAPTETENGVRTFTCTVCGQTKQEPIRKLNPSGQADALGDVDGDGEVTSGDARLALRASVQLEQYAPGSAQFAAADVDGNGVIESSDARTILRVSVKLEAFA